MSFTTFEINDVPFYFMFRSFRTEARAKSLWEQIERKTAEGDVSIVRFQDLQAGHKNCLAMVSELEEGIREYQHLLEDEGQPYEASDQIKKALALRRADRVVNEGGGALRHPRGVPIGRDGKLNYGPRRN